MVVIEGKITVSISACLLFSIRMLQGGRTDTVERIRKKGYGSILLMGFSFGFYRTIMERGVFLGNLSIIFFHRREFLPRGYRRATFV